jgi:uncharacterized membrane protein
VCCVFVDGVKIGAVVGGCVAALVVILVIVAGVVHRVRRMPGSGSERDNSDSSLNDLSADIAMSAQKIK